LERISELEERISGLEKENKRLKISEETYAEIAREHLKGVLAAQIYNLQNYYDLFSLKNMLVAFKEQGKIPHGWNIGSIEEENKNVTRGDKHMLKSDDTKINNNFFTITAQIPNNKKGTSDQLTMKFSCVSDPFSNRRKTIEILFNGQPIADNNWPKDKNIKTTVFDKYEINNALQTFNEFYKHFKSQNTPPTTSPNPQPQP
jgi:hypothetical protein